MKASNLTSVVLGAAFASLVLPSALAAQAFVDQASPHAGRSAYVEQVPPGAKPPVVRRQAAPSAPRRAAAKPKAAVVDEVVAAARMFPSVGAGSSAFVKLNTTREWPTVGGGTVRN